MFKNKHFKASYSAKNQAGPSRKHSGVLEEGSGGGNSSHSGHPSPRRTPRSAPTPPRGGEARRKLREHSGAGGPVACPGLRAQLRCSRETEGKYGVTREAWAWPQPPAPARHPKPERSVGTPASRVPLLTCRPSLVLGWTPKAVGCRCVQILEPGEDPARAASPRGRHPPRPSPSFPGSTRATGSHSPRTRGQVPALGPMLPGSLRPVLSQHGHGLAPLRPAGSTPASPRRHGEQGTPVGPTAKLSTKS